MIVLAFFLGFWLSGAHETVSVDTALISGTIVLVAEIVRSSTTRIVDAMKEAKR